MHKFKLSAGIKDTLRSMPLPFGYDGYGEYVFYRTYSRKYYNYPGEWLTKEAEDALIAAGVKPRQETWADVVIRVIEGTLSFRKDWHKKHQLAWNNNHWNETAEKMVLSFHKLHWSPPGRGCWAMGTDFVYAKGGMALSNCGFTLLGDVPRFADDVCWMMDALMCGVGVGFEPREEKWILPAVSEFLVTYRIADSREGWGGSVRYLINAHLRGDPQPLFDYSRIRKKGSPIRGFGGVCHGPEDLAYFHEQINVFFNMLRTRPDYNVTMLKTDIANACGHCVVSGNVRRSAEIAVADMNNETFLDLKSYEMERFAYRKEIGYMSNNSARFNCTEDFDKLGEIASRVVVRGEPGIVNRKNMPYGRIGKYDNVRFDAATGFNPCVTGDTLVMTSQGPKSVESSLTPFSAVVDGRTYDSPGFFCTGHKPVVKVCTLAGYEVRCTADHKIQTENGWKEAGELNRDDKVILNRSCVIWGGRGTESEGWLLGHLYGDGHISEKFAMLGFWGPTKEVMFAYARDLLRASVTGRSDMGSGGVLTSVDRMNIHSVGLKALAESYGIAGDKQLTNKVECTSRDFHVGFLRGWFDTDGTVVGDRLKGVSVRLTSVSYTNLVVAQRMLLRLGVKSTLYANRREAGIRQLPDGRGGLKDYPCQAYHELVISRSSLKVFHDNVNFAKPDKKEKLSGHLSSYRRKLYADHFSSKVFSVTPDGEEDVYDCQVEMVHAFDANGIIVHNCGEQPLEDKEVCTLAETYPTRCNTAEWISACEYATIYASTVAMIPTHHECTNAVMARNRRIGVGLVDYTGWIHAEGVHKVTRHLRDGYKTIRAVNKSLADEAGVIESIRVTTVKPGGTMPKLAGRTAGAGYPTFKYTLRRTREGIDSPTFMVLVAAGMKWEHDKYSANTAVFCWPIVQGPAPPGTEVSLWQQAMNLVLLQREWSDNAVSNTLYFNPETESKHVEAVLSSIVPLIKSCSLLPHTPKGAYEQMPEEGITEEEYHKLKAELPKIDWSILIGSDGSDEKYCEGPQCQTR